MAAPSPALPYGMRQIVLIPLTGATEGTPVPLPVSRTLSFKESEEFEQLEGDDTVAAIHGKGPIVDWELEAGGISLEAWEVMSGGTVTTSGTTPNITVSLKKNATDARPYFKIKGRSIGDSGGDFHVIIERAKVTGDLEGELSNGAFMLTNCSGQGIGATDDGDLWEFQVHETATAIPTA